MALFAAGVATIIQTVGYKEIGSRLPIIQGTSFAFIPIMLPFKAFGLGCNIHSCVYRRNFPNFYWKMVKTNSPYVSSISNRNSCVNDWN